MLECLLVHIFVFSNEAKAHFCNIEWFELLSLSRDDDGRRSGAAGGPRVHLSGKLKHKDDVRPLVWVRVDAHADQAPQLRQKVDQSCSSYC